MKMILRWFPNGDDTVTLQQIRQIPGVSGVATFLSDIPAGETPAVSHPNVTAQRTDMQNGKAVHVITVDLYRALWDWGEQHPEKRRYANSMRIAFHGAYKPDTESGGNSYLDKSIESVRSARKANKEKPKKKRRDTDPK